MELHEIHVHLHPGNAIFAHTNSAEHIRIKTKEKGYQKCFGTARYIASIYQTIVKLLKSLLSNGYKISQSHITVHK